MCGLPVCYNNFPDRKGRQKRYTYRGFFLCTRCDPRRLLPGLRRDDEHISNRRLYKGILARQVVKRLAQTPCVDEEIGIKQDGPCNCLPCLARRIERISV